MPDNVSLSGIEFTIKGSSDAASESVKKLTQELNNLKEALKKSEGIGGLATSLKKLENINTTMLSVANTILSEMSQLDFSNIREAAEGIKDIAAAARQIAGMGKSEQPLQEVIGEPDKIRTAITYLQEFGQAMLKAGKYTAQLAGAGLRGIGKMLAAPFQQAVPKVKGYAQALGGIVRSFGRILGYRIIRSVIREVTQAFGEGIKNLYAWSTLVNGEFKESMDSIATSMLYFKNSIGAAVAPIINALAPAIDFLVDKIVDLINVINQLFAKLTGAAYWTRAIKKTTEYEDAISGAGGAAKEALKYLAPFDELNRLPSEKKGGGGGSNDDPSGMFETVTEFEDTIANFADNIRAAIQAGDWQAVGTLLGDKVNEVVDSIDFAGAGARVGTAINAWFTTKYWTLDTINFTNIGSKIAEAFNGAIGQIDFEIIGRTLVQKFTKLGDAIIGAVETIDWGQVASSIGSFVSGFWNEIGDWFQETDFATLASSIWQGIKDAVTHVDWAEVATSIFRAIGSAIGAAASFVAQLAKDMLTDLWNAIVNASKTWDNDGDGELTGREIINGIWEGIKTALNNVGQWIKDNVFTPFLNGIKSAFGIHSPAEEMKPIGANIAEGIKEGIKNVFANIKQWVVDNILTPIQNAIDNAKEKIKIGIQIIKDGWKTVTGWLNETAQKGTQAVQKGIGLLRSGWDYVSTWIKNNYMGQSTPQKGVGIIRKGFDYVSTWIKENWMGQSTPQKGIGVVRKGWDFISTWIKDNYMGASTPTKGIGVIQKGWDYVSNWIIDNYMGASTPNKGIGIVRKGWDYVSNWVINNYMGKTTPQIGIGIKKEGWTTATQFVADTITGVVNQITTLYINGYEIDPYLRDESNLKVNATANITKTTGNVYGQMYYQAQALGGVFSNGFWKSIPQYAAGTTRAHGSLFLAGEAGPEVVGHVGGRTEVLNRSQLAATMYASVRNAMASVSSRMAGSPAGNYYADAESNEETMYRAFSRALADSDLGGDIELDGNVLYRAMVNRNRANTRLTGVNAMA